MYVYSTIHSPFYPQFRTRHYPAYLTAVFFFFTSKDDLHNVDKKLDVPIKVLASLDQFERNGWSLSAYNMLSYNSQVDECPNNNGTEKSSHVKSPRYTTNHSSPKNAFLPG